MSIHYIGLNEINGPLVVLEGVKDAAFDEIVEIAKEIADTKEWVNCTYNALKAEQILDIINKAREK